MTKIKWLSVIRITGLLLVLVYHFFRDTLPGGFIGVDIFFTLSGYLVTASIIEEFRNSGNYALFSFFKRRFMRIYPPLLLSILFSLPFTLLLSPDFVVNIGRQLAAALGFVTNYFEILGGGSYEARMLPHLFLHTWFLAVEIHLYLAWALFCAFIILLLKKVFNISAENNLVIVKILLCVFAAAGAVFSYLRMQTVYNLNTGDPSAAYFDTLARAFPFLLGAVTGSIFSGAVSGENTNNGEKPSWLLVLQCLALTGVMAGLTVALFALGRVLSFSGEETYRYGFAAASLITVIMILSARALHKTADAIEEPFVLSIIAALSYNIYLFHWPLYNVFFYTNRTSSLSFWNNNYAAAAALVISIALSCLLFFLMEPMLHGHRPVSKLNSPVLRRTVYAGISLFIMAAVSLNGLVFASAPELSSLEEQMYTGYLYQDIDEIGQLQRLIKSINDKPIVLPAAGYTQNRLFTGNISDPDLYALAMLPVTLNDDGLLTGVTVIGDSVCLGARKKLTDSIPNCYVDAEGSRQMFHGYQLMIALQNNFSLREYVVVSLGTNQNSNSISYIDRIIEDLPDGHRLIFVTPYNASMNESWNTYKIMQYIRTLPNRYYFVTVADWAAQIDKQPALLGSDKIHIGGNTVAINLFTNCIIDAINNAMAKSAKLENYSD